MSSAFHQDQELVAAKYFHEKHPQSHAFENWADPSITHEERLLEYEVEQWLGKCNDLVKQRKKLYSKAEPISVLPSERDALSLKLMREKRDKILEELRTPVECPPVVCVADVISREVNIAGGKRNTFVSVRTLLLDFFKSRKEVLANEKYKLLYRWARCCGESGILEKAFPVLDRKLRSIEREFEDTVSRCERIDNGSSSVEKFEDIPFGVDELNIYLRHTTHDLKTSKKFTRLLKKLQWLTMSKRSELLSESKKKSAEVMQVAPASSTMPMMLMSGSELEQPLDELKRALDVTLEITDEGHEFFYNVNKKFASAFASQSEAMNFVPLEDKELERHNGMGAPQPDEPVNSGASGDKVFLKFAKWNNWIQIHARPIEWAEKQALRLKEVTKIDHKLKVEAMFIDSTDLQYVSKRLREEVEMHLGRCRITSSPVKIQTLGEFRGRLPPEGFVGPGQRAGASVEAESAERNLLRHKLLGLYFLRYIRTREFRKRLLDILNYFRSIERRLTLDSYGYAFEGDVAEGEDKGGILPPLSARNHVLSNPKDYAQVGVEELMKMSAIENRDDKYKLSRDQQLEVYDSDDRHIVYDVALRDLECLEQELLRTGSHYIHQAAKNSGIEEGQLSQYDRFSVLEDLFECEAWYQQGKRKVIDCYMEAYEHAVDPNEQKRLAELITEHLAARPRLDLEAAYFCESYATEIVSLELSSNLFRDLISTQISEEKKSIEAIYGKIENFDKLDPSILDGCPLGLTKVPELEMSLFPGTSKICVLDIFPSTTLISRIHPVLEHCVGEISRHFNITSPGATNSLYRAVVQQMIVEWRLLVEEERIQRELRLKGDADIVDKMERRLIVDNPEEMYMAVQDKVVSYREEEVRRSSQAAARADQKPELQELKTSGGFPLDSVESCLVQLLASTVEVVHARSLLLDSLYECEILYNVYKLQASHLGREVKQSQLDPLKFGHESKDKLSDIERRLVDADEVVSIRTEYLSNLAIAEFERTMAQFDFQTKDGFSKLMFPDGLQELRTACQVQVLQKNMLLVVTKHNQLLMDEVLRQQHSSTFLTDTQNRNRERPFPGSDIFVSINALKLSRRNVLLREYSEKSASIMKSRSPDVIQKRLRELKYELIRGYCTDLIQDLGEYALKIQIFESYDRCRTLLEGVSGESMPFLVSSRDADGNEVDTEFDSGGEVLNSDGTVLNLWSIPRRMQVLKLCSGDTFMRGKKITILSCLLKAVASFHDIMKCIRLRHEMAVSAVDSIAYSAKLEGMSHDLSKIKVEIEHLSDPGDLEIVSSYLWKKRRELYCRTLLSMRNLLNQLLSFESQDGADILDRAIQYILPEQYGEPPQFQMPWLHNVQADHLPPTQKCFSSDFSVYGPFVGATVPPTISLLNISMTRLLEADRNYFGNEEMAVDLLIDDVLQEEKVYSTSQSEQSVEIVVEFLEISLTLGQTKSYFLRKFAQDDVRGASAPFSQLIEFYKERTMPKVKSVIEYFRSVEKSRAEASQSSKKKDVGVAVEKIADAYMKKITDKIIARSPKKLSESLLRYVQIFVIHQEIRKMLLKEEKSSVKMAYDRMVMEIETSRKHTSGELEMLESKMPIIQRFIGSVMQRCVRHREPSGEIICEMSEDHLDRCLDEMFRELGQWKLAQVDGRTSTIESMSRKYSRQVDLLGSHVKFIEHAREMDKRAMGRRVQVELADRNYELLYELDEMQKHNQELQKQLGNQETELRVQLKAQFEDRLRAQERELMISKSKFEEYRTYLYREMQNNLMEVKKEAMLKMVESENAPLELKRKALKIARFDDEINRMREENMELRKTIMKTRMFFNLRQATLRSRFEKDIRLATADRQKATREYWSNREKVEERENILRQQLLSTQNALNSAEIELQQLRKDLHLQMKNKQQLVHWKVKNAQLLEDLEVKVKKFERWGSIDVDRLLLDVEKKDTQLKQLRTLETRASKRTELIETRKEKEIRKLHRRIMEEQMMKQQAFSKLDLLRTELELDSNDVANLYRERFMEGFEQLEESMKEIEYLRTRLDAEGLELPEESMLFADTVLNVDLKDLPSVPSPSVAHRPQTTAGYMRQRRVKTAKMESRKRPSRPQTRPPKLPKPTLGSTRKRIMSAK